MAIPLVILIVSILILYKFYPIWEDKITNFSFNNEVLNKNITKKNSQTESEIVQQQIDSLKKKMKIKWLVNSWDSFLENKYYLFALKDYLKANIESPYDKNIINKIWLTYFSMKNFSRAYWYFRKINDYKNLDKDKAILSLFYSKEINLKNMQYFFTEIDYFNLSDEKTFYYKNSIKCLEDLSICKKVFSDYLDDKDKKWLKIESPELNDIKTAFTNYENFKLDDSSYKNAILIWVFLKNKLYTIAINLWKKILIDKPNYKPVMLIVWKSYFELWKYKDAKIYLNNYLELEPNDVDVVYLLWIINSENDEYIVSNIYLKSAIDKWYKKTINIRRRMIYNFAELWETAKMLDTFKELMEKEKNLDKNDYSLYIYYNIINWRLNEAEDMGLKSINLFKDDDNFYGYLWWIYKEKWNTEEAEKYLNKWLELNPQNPIINLNLWQIAMQKEEYSKALIYLKNTISFDKSEDFATIAKDELEKVKLRLNNNNN